VGGEKFQQVAILPKRKEGEQFVGRGGGELNVVEGGTFLISEGRKIASFN